MGKTGAAVFHMWFTNAIRMYSRNSVRGKIRATSYKGICTHTFTPRVWRPTRKVDRQRQRCIFSLGVGGERGRAGALRSPVAFRAPIAICHATCPPSDWRTEVYVCVRVRVRTFAVALVVSGLCQYLESTHTHSVKWTMARGCNFGGTPARTAIFKWRITLFLERISTGVSLV